MTRFPYIFIVICSSIIYVNAKLIAYDCGPNSTSSETTFTEFDPQQCNDPSEHISSAKEWINILHYNDKDIVEVRQCRIKIVTLKTGCGRSSHMFAVSGGFTTTLKKISRQECNDMHNKKLVIIDKRAFKLRINDTANFNYIRGGSVDDNGNCKPDGDVYIDQVVLEITLKQLWLEADVDHNLILFPNGALRRYTISHYYDPVYGHSFWNVINNRWCLRYRFSILYSGTAWKYHSKTLKKNVYYYSSKDIEFVIPVTSKMMTICRGVILHSTFYDKLYIVTNRRSLNYMPNRSKFRAADLMAARAILEVDILNEKLKSQQCQLRMHEKQMSYMLTVGNSDEFAYFKMRAFGFTSSRCEGQILIKKCSEVEVQVRTTKSCYDHIPIIYNDTDVYMTTRTHVIKDTAKKVDCRLNTPLDDSKNRRRKGKPAPTH